MTIQKPRKTAQPVSTSPSTSFTTIAPYKLRNWQCIVLLAVMVMVFFRDILLGNAFLWEDFLYYNYPVRSFAATSMAMGNIPLWNPYVFGGMPFAADILTTVFYLPCTVLMFLVHDGKLNFYWLQLIIILHFVLAGVSSFSLAKSLGLQQLPSLVAGVAFMLSGYMVVHAIHQPIITLSAWIPLIILLFRRTLVEHKWKWVFLTAIVLGHSILAGFPQLSLYLYFFLFIWFVFEICTTYRGKALLSVEAILMTVRAASVIILSLTLAAVQLLPTIELAAFSKRAETTYQFAAEGSLAWSQLFTFLFPKLFGSAGAEGYNYFGPGAYYDYWETCIYLGLLPFVLSILSLFWWKKDKHIPLLWGIALFAVLYALGSNFFLHRFFFDFVPGFARFRNPARIGIFIGLASALLAAFSAQYLIYGERAKKDILILRNILLMIAGVGVAAWIMVRSGGIEVMLPFLKNQQARSIIYPAVNSSALMLILSIGVVMGMLVRGRQTRWIAFATIGVMFFDFYTFGGTQNNGTVNPASYFAQSEQLVGFLKQEEEKGVFRVNTRNAQGMVMDRNQGMIDRLFTMEGYAPLALQRSSFPMTTEQWMDILNVKYRTVTDEKTHALLLSKNDSYFQRAFFLYDFHVVRNEEALLAYIKSPAFDHRTTAVLEKDPGRPLQTPSTTPKWKAKITKYANNEISLEAETSHDGFLVLSEMYYPGWNAYVDGQKTEIFQTDYNLRGFFVSKGPHHVDVRFEPVLFKRGVLLTTLALIVCVLGFYMSSSRFGSRRVITSEHPIS